MIEEIINGMTPEDLKLLMPMIDNITLIHLKKQQAEKKQKSAMEIQSLNDMFKEATDDLLAVIIATNADRVKAIIGLN